MIELVTKDTDPSEDEVRMIALFSIDGVEYSVPDRVRPSLALQYLHRVNTDGIGLAEAWLGAQLLGDAAYAALISFEDITPDQIRQVLKAARAVAFGENDEGKETARPETGSGRSGSTNSKRTKS